jgi:hypothetical protein
MMLEMVQDRIETWTLRAVDRNTWKVLKCGVGGGWKRSVGLIM